MGRRAARRSARSGPCSGDAAAAAAGSAGRGADRDPGSRIRDRDLRRRAGRVTVRDADPARRARRSARASGRRPRGPRREALGLWRGAPLADIPSQLLRDQWVPHLDQLQVQALDWRIEADLHDGRHEQVIPELRDLTARHPLREHLHGQLMLALYRCGRQARGAGRLPARPRRAGRRARRRARARAAGPAPADPVRRPRPGRHRPRATPRGASGDPRRGTPRELPPAVPGFAGRAAELAALTGLLDRPGEQAPGRW